MSQGATRPTEAKSEARFASARSTSADAKQAFTEICLSAQVELGATPDLAVLFASPHHAPHMRQIAEGVCDALDCDTLLGCTGESIVEGAREFEQEPAMSLWLARLPGTRILPMHLEFERTADGGTFTGWPAELDGEWPSGAAMLLLGEPFSFPADDLLRRLNDDRPGVPVLGGMASGFTMPGENRVILGWREIREGAAAVLIWGDVSIRSVVSQGCRPIGTPYVVTRAEANVIYELGGRPPLARLQELFPQLSEREQFLVRRGLHVGRVLSEYQERFQRGDFLVRNVIGVDEKTGAMAVGDYLRAGQTVQFHIRDEETADEDLRELAGAVAKQVDGPAGALLFTCNGRGRRMFSTSDHDAACLRQTLGDIPVAGFFAMGEIGPVGGKNFLHGFTASVALFG